MNIEEPEPGGGNIGGAMTLGKNAVDLVGVLVSSDSLIHNGFDDPDLDGPGDAIDEYPELLKLDSEAVLLAQVVMIVNGLKYVMPLVVVAVLDVLVSASDSNSDIGVIVIAGPNPGDKSL